MINFQRNIISYFNIFGSMNNTVVPGRRGAFRGGFTLTTYQQFHHENMMYLWTIVINVSIFLAMYKYRKYTVFLHFLLSMGVSVVTIVFSLPLILNRSIPSTSSPTRTHMIIGISILSLISLEVLLGCLCKILNIFKIPSVVLHYMNKIHVVIGYSLAILCKFQYYYITSQKKTYVYWLLLSQDIVFALMIVARKRFFPTLQERIQPKYTSTEDIPSISAFSDLKQKQISDGEIQENIVQKQYCFFGNYVYDMSPLRLVHPAGYQILHVVRNRQIDRFIYGMYRAELLPKLPTNSHSFKSLDLLGSPVAKIDISSPYRYMPNCPFEVTVSSIQSISMKCKIYQIELTNEAQMEYEGYSDIKQLGRFYSLTANNKVTRLYTAVNFLHQSNIDLLRSLQLIDSSFVPPAIAQGTQIQMQTDRLSSWQNKIKNTIPLLIKVYEDGTLPNLLISNKAKSLTLSPPKGFGLKLTQTPHGTILIIAGGTGLYPFSDLIDLLYKDSLVQRNHLKKDSILTKNPILSANPFEFYQFKLLLACQFLEDIHPITLKQLKTLALTTSFDFKLKIRQKIDDQQLNGINLLSGPFQNVLQEELLSIKDLSKVWLCGPPKMCESITQYFEKNYQGKDLVHLI